MKLFHIFLVLLFSTSAFAAAPETLIELEGTSVDGSTCNYSVVVMNHWEGQTAIFISADTGSFRVELDTDALDVDLFVSPYNDVVMSSSHLNLNVVVPASEWGDFDKEVNLIFELRNILKPISVTATHGGEWLDCSFEN